MTRTRLALIAFAFHAPGMRVLAGHALRAGVMIINVIAVAATVIAMIVVAELGGGAWAVGLAWLCGHLVWGGVLAALVLAGRASTPVVADGAPP